MVLLRNVVVGILLAGVARGQDRTNFRMPVTPVQAVSEAGPQGSVEDELHVMSAQAGVIFAGEVLKITRQGEVGSGWVDVEFRVEEAIRGCAGQETYRLREWAGLWAGGAQRYRVGERLLMMLHTPGAQGLSSPVGGQDGAIPLVGMTQAPGPEDRFTNAGGQAVDLRWVHTRLLRTAAAAPLETQGARPRGVRRNDRLRAGDGSYVQAVASSVGIEEQRSSLQAVMGLLASWEVERANAGR